MGLSGLYRKNKEEWVVGAALSVKQLLQEKNKSLCRALLNSVYSRRNLSLSLLSGIGSRQEAIGISWLRVPLKIGLCFCMNLGRTRGLLGSFPFDSWVRLHFCRDEGQRQNAGCETVNISLSDEEKRVFWVLLVRLRALSINARGLELYAWPLHQEISPRAWFKPSAAWVIGIFFF